MKIQIIATQLGTATSSKGTPYETLEVTFKNLTFNKTETKKLMPFGDNKDAFTALKQAKQGDTFEIGVKKNNAGYNDWVSVAPASAGASVPAADKPASTSGGRSGGWETPEERAKKQIYIVRQSSISAAVAALSTGAKAAPKPEDVVAYAKALEAYVFDTSVPAVNDSGFDDMASDDFSDVPL